MAANEFGGTVEPVEVASGVTRNARPSNPVGIVSELYEALDKAVGRLETIRVRLCRNAPHDGTAKAELVDYIRQCEAEADAALAKTQVSA